MIINVQNGDELKMVLENLMDRIIKLEKQVHTLHSWYVAGNNAEQMRLANQYCNPTLGE